MDVSVKGKLHFDLAFSLRPRFHEIAAHAHPYSNLNSSTDNRCETLALAIIASSMPASTTRLKQHSLCSTVISSASLIYMVSLVRSISNPHLQCRATTGLKCAFRASLFLACEPEPSGHLTTPLAVYDLWVSRSSYCGYGQISGSSQSGVVL